MPKFDYTRPESLPQALTLVNDFTRTNRLLAGGTDLLVHLHHYEPEFDRIVDISLLPELKIIARAGDSIHLGSNVSFAEVIESDLLCQTVPFLVEACQLVGGPQIRNMGTLGGNVVNAAACADSLPVLVCLDATAHVSGLSGQRAIPLAEFVLKPNVVQLQPGEILTHFSFDVPPPGVQTAFIKLGRRKAQAISRLTMAAMGRLDAAGAVDFVRLTPGAATPQIMRFPAVEGMLMGQAPTPELLAEAGRQTAESMIAITGRRWSTEFKEPVIAALAERALQRVFVHEKSGVAS
jgi:CO/xanthine dehydrogenase FAD-binding subunit